MKFKATEDQLKQIALNAIKASRPVGMGFMHHEKGDEETFTPEMINIAAGRMGRGVFVDYFKGRMVKLSINASPLDGDDVWSMGEIKPDIEYQSWLTTYPTYELLAQSVEGIEILQ